MRKGGPETTPLWGGALCLDFVNSVDWSEEERPLAPETDVVRDPDELTRWARRVGILASGAPPIDEAELSALHVLRLAVYRGFAAHTRARKPPAGALERITADHAAAAGAGALIAGGDAWRLEWPGDDPRRVRFAIAVDAVAVFGDADRLSRVRRCPGRGCGWLFLDTSGRRRWCSMTTCGSREKMRRLYQRQHHATADG